MGSGVHTSGDEAGLRILILAPSGRDASLAEQAIARSGLLPHVCADFEQLQGEISAGAGAVLIAEEALPRSGNIEPENWIGPEPPWSSLPLVVLTGRSTSARSAPMLRRLERRPAVSFIERPVPKRTMISMLRAAIESRIRQYSTRDFLQEQLQLQEALLESEQRASSVLKSIVDGFIALDNDWRIVFANSRGGKVLRPFGRGEGELLGKRFHDELPEAAKAAFGDVFDRASRSQSAAVQAFYPPLDAWFDVRASASTGGVAIHFLDITERKQAEKHRELLVDELNHRVKNTLALVQAIAHQTFKGSAVPEELRTTFENRLTALAAAHDLLTRANWEQALLEELVSRVVAATGGYNNRITMTGPAVVLDPKTAVTFAMALHELCTNALKYGALSTEAGHVDIRWSMSAAPDAHLTLIWRERGGPLVEVPRRKGFGSIMIEQALAQEIAGEIEMDFAPEGLECTIRGTLPRPPDMP